MPVPFHPHPPNLIRGLLPPWLEDVAYAMSRRQVTNIANGDIMTEQPHVALALHLACILRLLEDNSLSKEEKEAKRQAMKGVWKDEMRSCSDVFEFGLQQ
jgi:hypothetical protein